MQASRLLSILLRLQLEGRISARALAQVFEVSVRTIYRDIDALSAAGVPVYAEKGRRGGFQLRDGYRTRLTGLDRPEAESLFLAGAPYAATQLGLGAALETMRLKLLASLPEATAREAERVSSRFHLDPVAWFQGPDEQRLLPELGAAVWTGRKVQLRYDSWKGVVERSVAPLVGAEGGRLVPRGRDRRTAAHLSRGLHPDVARGGRADAGPAPLRPAGILEALRARLRGAHAGRRGACALGPRCCGPWRA